MKNDRHYLTSLIRLGVTFFLFPGCAGVVYGQDSVKYVAIQFQGDSFYPGRCFSVSIAENSSVDICETQPGLWTSLEVKERFLPKKSSPKMTFTDPNLNEAEFRLKAGEGYVREFKEFETLSDKVFGYYMIDVSRVYWTLEIRGLPKGTLSVCYLKNYSGDCSTVSIDPSADEAGLSTDEVRISELGKSDQVELRFSEFVKDKETFLFSREDVNFDDVRGVGLDRKDEGRAKGRAVFNSQLIAKMILRDRLQKIDGLWRPEHGDGESDSQTKDPYMRVAKLAKGDSREATELAERNIKRQLGLKRVEICRDFCELREDQ